MAGRMEEVDTRPTPEAKRTVSLTRAEEPLADRTRFGLKFEQWREFQEALDAPSRLLPRLNRLLSEPSVFESADPS